MWAVRVHVVGIRVVTWNMGLKEAKRSWVLIENQDRPRVSATNLGNAY
jgi:hypothetical protein